MQDDVNRAMAETCVDGQVSLRALRHFLQQSLGVDLQHYKTEIRRLAERAVVVQHDRLEEGKACDTALDGLTGLEDCRRGKYLFTEPELCDAVCTTAAWRGTWEPLPGCRLTGAAKQLRDVGMGCNIPQEPRLGHTRSTFQLGRFVTPERVSGTTQGAGSTFVNNRALGLEIPVMLMACKSINIVGEASGFPTAGNAKVRIWNKEDAPPAQRSLALQDFFAGFKLSEWVVLVGDCCALFSKIVLLAGLASQNRNFNWGSCGLHGGQNEDDMDGAQVLAKSGSSEIMNIGVDSLPVQVKIPNQDGIVLVWQCVMRFVRALCGEGPYAQWHVFTPG